MTFVVNRPWVAPTVLLICFSNSWKKHSSNQEFQGGELEFSGCSLPTFLLHRVQSRACFLGGTLLEIRGSKTTNCKQEKEDDGIA